MNLRQVIQSTLMVLLYLTLQILLFRNVALFNYAFCFVYIGAILLLPAELDRLYLLLIAFVVGCTVDLFSNTYGMHAAATVLIAYLRPFVHRYQVESKGIERLDIGLRSQGFVAFSGYMLSLLFVHQSVLFFIEMNNLGMMLYTLARIIASMAFTFIVILLVELFSRR